MDENPEVLRLIETFEQDESLTPQQAEEVVVQIFQGCGLDAEYRGGPGDLGVDVEFTTDEKNGKRPAPAERKLQAEPSKRAMDRGPTAQTSWAELPQTELKLPAIERPQLRPFQCSVRPALVSWRKPTAQASAGPLAQTEVSATLRRPVSTRVQPLPS